MEYKYQSRNRYHYITNKNYGLCAQHLDDSATRVGYAAHAAQRNNYTGPSPYVCIPYMVRIHNALCKALIVLATPLSTL